MFITPLTPFVYFNMAWKKGPFGGGSCPQIRRLVETSVPTNLLDISAQAV